MVLIAVIGLTAASIGSALFELLCFENVALLISGTHRHHSYSYSFDSAVQVEVIDDHRSVLFGLGGTRTTEVVVHHFDVRGGGGNG